MVTLRMTTKRSIGGSANSKQGKLLLLVFWLLCLHWVNGLREFRSWSERHQCSMAQDANYPFAMEKYHGMSFEGKGRVNSNLQDFRHQCQVRGGQSKCHICEDIICKSDVADASCFLQLQGVHGSNMSANIMNIVVKGQDGEEVHFKVKKTTPFKKIMDAYCTKRGLARMYIRFFIDGERIEESDTPKMKEIEDGDQIDAMMEQEGGGKIHL